MRDRRRRILHETRGSALLTMERIACDYGGRLVEFGQHLYRPSRYALTITMPTNGTGQGTPGSG